MKKLQKIKEFLLLWESWILLGLLFLFLVFASFMYGVWDDPRDEILIADEFTEEQQEVIFDMIPSPEVYDFHSKEIECLAMNIYHEARGDNLAGQYAVADVVLNRVHDKRYPDTVCGVVYDAKMSEWWLERGKEVPARNRCQFSWYCDGRLDEPATGDSWESAKLIANEIYEHYAFRGITEGATHYHATYVNPTWINDRGMHMVGRVGEHIFYRWNNGKGS